MTVRGGGFIASTRTLFLCRQGLKQGLIGCFPKKHKQHQTKKPTHQKKPQQPTSPQTIPQPPGKNPTPKPKTKLQVSCVKNRSCRLFLPYKHLYWFQQVERGYSAVLPADTAALLYSSLSDLLAGTRWEREVEMPAPARH